jgi:hypothetical protein
MATDVDLTGHWTGHYFQRDQARAIAADLVQTGESLQGRMRDDQTEFEQSVFETAVEAGLPPGADEQIIARLRRQFPDEPAAPIRATSTLPPTSVLAGSVRGRRVYFLKTYQGEAFSGYRVGCRQVGLTIEQHGVHYDGRLSADGTTLEGRWLIEPLPGYGSPRTEGRFLLRRQANPEIPLSTLRNPPPS